MGVLSTVAQRVITQTHGPELVVPRYQRANPVGDVPGALRYIAGPATLLVQAHHPEARLQRRVVCTPVALEEFPEREVARDLQLPPLPRARISGPPL